MISAAPTIVALQNDSAWVVVVGVSVVTFTLVVLIRRMIARPGGLMSAALLALPLVLPLVAAATFQSAVFPEIAMLRPAGPSLADDPSVFLFHAPESQLLIPYRLVGISGVWLLIVAGGASVLMLVRRFVCAAAAGRLMGRCVSPTAEVGERLARLLGEVAERLDLDRLPQVLLLPGDRSGVFCSRRGGGHVFISRQLLDCLSDDELRGVLAHEIAHLRARDTTVAFLGGLLRDVVVWNPVAHLAHRRLLADRELEADRVAASVTGPLPIASGLVKVCEALGRKKTLAQRVAVAFLHPNGGIKRRVRALLAMADGSTSLEPSARSLYVLAAALVAAIGLQTGAQLARQQPGFSAIFLGAPSVSSVEAWPTTDELVVEIKTHARRKEARLKKVRREARLRAKEFRLAAIRGVKPDRPYGFREEELQRWLRAVAALGPQAADSGDRALMVSQAWRAELPRSGLGPISVVRIHYTNLEEKEVRPPASTRPSESRQRTKAPD